MKYKMLYSGGDLINVIDLTKEEFDHRVNKDKRCFGDAIIFIVENVYCYIPFTYVRHATVSEKDAAEDAMVNHYWDNVKKQIEQSIWNNKSILPDPPSIRKDEY